MSKEREQEVFNKKMSEKGSLEFGGERENGLKYLHLCLQFVTRGNDCWVYCLHV